MATTPASLLYGTLDVLVLRCLASAPLHGYGIAIWLRDRSGGAFAVDDAALYKSLHRLEEQGAIASDWRLTENNRRAKYYRLGAAGHRRLKAEHETWREFSRVVNRILRPHPT